MVEQSISMKHFIKKMQITDTHYKSRDIPNYNLWRCINLTVQIFYHLRKYLTSGNRIKSSESIELFWKFAAN